MQGNEYMLKSFHLGHVREARAKAFSWTRTWSEMKAVQASETQAKEYSVASVSLQNIKTRWDEVKTSLRENRKVNCKLLIH